MLDVRFDLFGICYLASILIGRLELALPVANDRVPSDCQIFITYVYRT